MKENESYVYTNRLKAERVRRGYTLRDMAEKLGRSSASSYKYIEDGIVEPKISTINKIAEILEQPAHYFFRLKVQRSQFKKEEAEN